MSLVYAASHSPGHSTGRGGYANITDLRSPDIEPPIHVTHPEHERVSTGRGGVGNIRDRSNSKVRDQPEPHIHHPIAEENFYSSGRGGAGNIRSRSQSKPPKDEKVRFSSCYFTLSSMPPSLFHSPPLPRPPFRSHVTRVPYHTWCSVRNSNIYIRFQYRRSRLTLFYLQSHHHDHKLGVEKVIHKVIHPNPHA